MRPIRQGDPDGVNYYTPYPVGKGVRNYSAQDIVGAIDVRIQATPIAGAEQSALDPLAGVDVMFAHRLQIEEAAFARVALLAHHDLDADQLRLVLEHHDEARMGHKHEVLIRSLPQSNRLFPAVVLTDDQRADAV